jgi:deoxycytidylate deaminase
VNSRVDGDKFPELIFGLVGAIGTNLELVAESLAESLLAAGYHATPIRLSALIRALNAPWSNLPDRGDPNYYDKAMDAGNNLREKLQRNDAVAALAIANISDLRKEQVTAKSFRLKRAYILHSLKRPEEIKLLREVYGSTFFVISAYAPRSSRVDRLASQLAERQHKNQSNAMRSLAEKLILRDESERLTHGQDVRKTYPLADLFLKTTSSAELQKAISRFVAIIFGDIWKTPTRDEQGMMLASIASLRSASPARQVGAALTSANGKVFSIGTNEVPLKGGGQYWDEDAGDGRDFTYEALDVSDKMRLNLLSDVIDRLRGLGLLSQTCPETSELLKTGSKIYPALKEAQLFDTIDFIRAVHAEASALLSAGALAVDATMYVTTFPCHECARHIVFAGIKRVVYVEPYPKSLVSELFKDSVSVDPEVEEGGRVDFVPFMGIAPSLYIQAFRASQKGPRKGSDGTITKWSLPSSFPHLPVPYSLLANHVNETDTIDELISQLTKEGMIDEPNKGRKRRNQKGVARKGRQRRKG